MSPPLFKYTERSRRKRFESITLNLQVTRHQQNYTIFFFVKTYKKPEERKGLRFWSRLLVSSQVFGFQNSLSLSKSVGNRHNWSMSINETYTWHSSPINHLEICYHNYEFVLTNYLVYGFLLTWGKLKWRSRQTPISPRVDWADGPIHQKQNQKQWSQWSDILPPSLTFQKRPQEENA